MTRHLRLPIVAGETNCSPERGKWCRFVTWASTHWKCHLFETKLREVNYWLQRLPERLAAERDEVAQRKAER